MKVQFSTIVYLCCFLSATVLVHEYLNANKFIDDLGSNESVKENSGTSKLIYKHYTKYISSQFKAATIRAKRVSREIIKLICLTFVAYSFFNKEIRSTLSKLFAGKMTVFGKESFYIKRAELNYLCVFFMAIFIIKYELKFLKMFLGIPYNTILEILGIVILFTIIVPLSIGIIYNMLNSYKITFIYALYAAFFLKFFIEYFGQEDVDTSKFKKVDIKEFSAPVKNFLRERQLQDKVYKEINQSKSINAALVGWGKKEHIEIYGNHDKFNDREFEAVLMHEIGHSKDYSLHKKAIVSLLIEIAEVSIMVYLYNRLSHNYKNSILSHHGVFIVLFIIYQTYIYKYLSVFHKLASEFAEYNADIIAKNKGFGKELSNVLFVITLQSKEFIKSTLFYNLLTSYHPTIYDRVEYLNK